REHEPPQPVDLSHVGALGVQHGLGAIASQRDHKGQPEQDEESSPVHAPPPDSRAACTSAVLAADSVPRTRSSACRIHSATMVTAVAAYIVPPMTHMMAPASCWSSRGERPAKAG